MRSRISSLLMGQKKDGESVTVCGWVRSKRVNKNVAFVVLNDGSAQKDMQCIVDPGTAAYDALGDVTVGAALRIDGVLKESPGKGQSWEVHTDKLTIEGTSAEDILFRKKAIRWNS